MLDLTPGERRGAITLVLLLLLGAAHDLWLIRQPPAPAPEVPRERVGPTPVGTPQAGRATPMTGRGPLDLNRASVSELDALPGIGPVLAGRIVGHRERHGGFRSREDLLAVQGIGPRLYSRLDSLVTVGPRSAPATRVSGSPSR